MLFLKQIIPNEKISEETKKYRTIGLGYTNLGALIMALGLPYDSERARELAAAITSLMTSEAYKFSAELASFLGPFPEFERNREPMLEVIKLHREYDRKIGENSLNKEILKLSRQNWDEALTLGEKYGFRNAQTTVLAPTGTISFALDADTTGVEPDFLW